MRAFISNPSGQYSNRFEKIYLDHGQISLQQFTYHQNTLSYPTVLIHELVCITPNTYDHGYIQLPNRIANNSDVLIMVAGGPVLINRNNARPNITEHHYTVIDQQYIVFRNNVTIHDITVTDLTEALHIGDVLNIWWPSANTTDIITTYAVQLTHDMYDDGFLPLTSTPAVLIAMVSGGPILQENLQYKIIENYFVFRNITIDAHIITDLDESLREGDILVITEFNI